MKRAHALLLQRAQVQRYLAACAQQQPHQPAG
jgi:hypothetical protein